MRKTKDSLKVMLVEDSMVMLKVLGRYLASMDINEPLVANTGASAIDLYRNERPDIILLDVMLPDIDGFEVASQIRALERPNEWTAIIFLTSLTSDEDLARGIAVGGDDYLTKPISEVVLHAKMRAMRRLVEMHGVLSDVTQQLNVA